LCIAGFDGYFKLLNPAWQATLGFTQEDLLAQPHLEFVHPEDREATRKETAKLTTDGAVVALENRYRCKDGSYKRLSWKAVPFADAQLVYAVARDVSERKRVERRRAAEHAVTRVLADSAKLGEALLETLKAVCESLEWDTGLLWTVSHPLGGPSPVLKCVEVWHAPAVHGPDSAALTPQRTCTSR